MSFDYSIRPRDPSRVIPPEQFFAFFNGRPHYSLDERDLDYYNEKTDASFSLLYGRMDDGTSHPQHNPDGTLLDFRMSYSQGSSSQASAIEAARELELICQQFDCEVCDPQVDGCEVWKPFVAADFIASVAESFNWAADVVEHFRSQGENIIIPHQPQRKWWWPFSK